MRLFTIGFTRKPARRFFELLRSSGAKPVVDVRLHNSSQLAGFSKSDDLAFFLHEICGMDYVHLPALAPTALLLDAYKKQPNGDWGVYEKGFLELMKQRRIEDTVPPGILADACLLCSEAEPHYCHRRLVAEYLAQRWGEVDVLHL